MPAQSAVPTPDQLAFRNPFRELVESNTTLSSGSCTEATEKMADRLRKAGMPALRSIRLPRGRENDAHVPCG
jgi:hypothetical protein